jgi:uncharacterized membrane protein YkoI
MEFAARKALSGRGQQLVIAVAAGALAGAAATVFAAGDGDQSATARLSVEQAADTALKAVPGGRIEGLEVDYDGRNLLWEADVLVGDDTQRELHINARNGRVHADQIDPPDRDAKPGDGTSGLSAQAAALRSARITASQAAQAALATVPATLTSVDFEYHWPEYVWEVDVIAENGQERKLLVDAASGEVARIAGENDG